MQRLDHFMGKALSSYYDSRDPLGVAGDFTTAPEISQLFGEIIGIWTAQKWMVMGSPNDFNLIEIGPGRGTLISDLLRATKHIPNFHDAMNIHLIETSSTLKEKQRTLIKQYDVEWHEHLSHIKNDKPNIIIANEFFDALPIRQFKYSNNLWSEHYIENEQSVWKKTNEPIFLKSAKESVEGDILEYSKEQEEYAHLISTYKGHALIIDYGYMKTAFGDSLQALHKHKPCKITDNIGDADLTSHIDFEWISSFFKKTKITTQSQFLQENGIAIRYKQLNDEKLYSGYERLINQNQMGELFKVLEISNLNV